MSLDEILAKAATSVLIEQMRPTRRVHIQPRTFIPPILPPPPVPLPTNSNWPASFQASIESALSKAWSPGTIKTYTSSINTFLKFCHAHHIPPSQTFPASEYLLCAFVASLQPSISKSTIKNYLTGLRAWHTNNGYPFTRSDRLNVLAKSSRPNANRAPLRPPVSLEMLESLAQGLNLSQSFDACVFACASSAFWGLARLGEFLPPDSNFDRQQPPFPRVSNVSPGRLGSLQIHLPWTKVKKWDGEDIIISVQQGRSSPVAAIQNHLRVSSLPEDSLLFSFNGPLGITFLLKREFLNRCDEIWRASPSFNHHTTGHSFRIGGTSHLLLCGIHPDIIKKTGRWSSDSFLRYWRNLETVIPSHTSNIGRQHGPVGEPRLSLGCGLLPSGVASPDGGSISAVRSQTARSAPT